METIKKARLTLTVEELETIYNALNRLAVQYSGKSESLNKICEAVNNGNPGIIVEPDHFQRLWEKVGDIKHRVYLAEQRLKK